MMTQLAIFAYACVTLRLRHFRLLVTSDFCRVFCLRVFSLRMHAPRPRMIVHLHVLECMPLAGLHPMCLVSIVPTKRSPTIVAARRRRCVGQRDRWSRLVGASARRSLRRPVCASFRRSRGDRCHLSCESTRRSGDAAIWAAAVEWIPRAPRRRGSRRGARRRRLRGCCCCTAALAAHLVLGNVLLILALKVSVHERFALLVRD